MCRINFRITGKPKKDLRSFAKRHNISIDEAARRALAMITIAENAEKNNYFLGIIEKDKENKLKVISPIEGM